MLGNVREWVADLYAPYETGQRIDPRGPASGTQHIVRGGSWAVPSDRVRARQPANVRADDMASAAPETTRHSQGLRRAVFWFT
jgi:formylglycine-generating enzyme required for sulfatase activity